MPYDPTNPKDVWAKVERLKQKFTARDTLLKRCEDILDVLPTDWFPDRRLVQHEGAKAMLQTQQQRATVLVAQPFRVRLPMKPQMTQADRERLEHMELLLGGAVDIFREQARLQNRRPPDYRVAASAVERGAVAAYWYWKKGLRGWRPCLEIYDPIDMYYESDNDGLTEVAVGFTYTEAVLAGYIQHQPLWTGTYDDNSHAEKTFYFCWAREPGTNTVSWGVVGEEGKGQGSDTKQNLLEMHEDNKHKWIPMSYIPAGGPFAREKVSGQPFVATMLADRETADFFTRLYAAGSVLAGMPAVTQTDTSGNTKTIELTPGEVTRIPPGTTLAPVELANPAALAPIAQQIALSYSQIEQKGLGGAPSGQPSLPRSELLRQGLAESINQMAMPFIDCYESAWVDGLTKIRDQARILMEDGRMAEVNLEVVPKGQFASRPKRELATYVKTELLWDGAVEIVVRPKQTRESIVANFQTFALVRQNEPRIPVSYLMEELLDFEQATLLLAQGDEELLDAQMAPAVMLLKLEDRKARLGALLVPVEGSLYIADPSPEDADFLEPLLKKFDRRRRDEGYLLGDVQVLIDFLGGLIADLKTRILPSQPLGAGSPAKRATTSPEVLPSQLDKSAGGRNGSGGINDRLALMLTQGQGSDQTRGG